METVSLELVGSELWVTRKQERKKVIGAEKELIDRNMLTNPWRLVYDNTLYKEYALLGCGSMYSVRLDPLSSVATFHVSQSLPVRGRVLSPVDFPTVLTDLGCGRARVSVLVYGNLLTFELFGFVAGPHQAVIVNDVMSIVGIY